MYYDHHSFAAAAPPYRAYDALPEPEWTARKRPRDVLNGMVFAVSFSAVCWIALAAWWLS
ncbi:hypothetical protein [Novosphingobium colocasiae]|uniref:hypothetical protein n=1 Tax=Novosphingobium colocasiae TaxID=1256513 RepID=UPI0035B3201B